MPRPAENVTREASYHRRRSVELLADLVRVDREDPRVVELVESLEETVYIRLEAKLTRR